MPLLLRCAVALAICWIVTDAAVADATSQPSFDVGVAKLPVQFKGNTVEWVLRYPTLAPRGASETNSEYAARRRAFRSEVFAFVIDRFESDYDRAAGMLTVTVRPATRDGTSAAGYYSIFDVHREKLSVSTRAGPTKWSRNDRPVANERGAVLSAQRQWKQTQIVTNEGRYDGSLQPLVFRLKTQRSRDLRVALVCMPRLEQFAPAGDETVPEATRVDLKADGSFQQADENVTYFVALRCNLLQVWLFDFKTGEVFGRFTPQGVFVPR